MGRFPLIPVELYDDESAGLAALQSVPGQKCKDHSPLPDWAKPPEIVEVKHVTILRPDDAAIRKFPCPPADRYLNLVRNEGRDRLLLNLTGITPFGHPFWDAIMSLLGDMTEVNGRLGFSNPFDAFVELLTLHRLAIKDFRT